MIRVLCDEGDCREVIYEWISGGVVTRLPDTDLWRGHLCQKCRDRYEAASKQVKPWYDTELTKLDEEKDRRFKALINKNK